jgi:predicted PP-loop superfamily ATPase
METLRSLDQQQSDRDQVYYGILDHYFMVRLEDPEFENAKIRMPVGIVLFSTLQDHNTTKFILRRNIKKVLEQFEKELTERLYR